MRLGEAPGEVDGHEQPDERDGASDDSVPGEGSEAVAADDPDEPADHHDRDHERDEEADRDLLDVIADDERGTRVPVAQADHSGRFVLLVARGDHAPGDGSTQPRDSWDANLHLMLKLVGSSYASGWRSSVSRSRRT